MGFFKSPTSFRLNNYYGDGVASVLRRDLTDMAFGAVQTTMKKPHESHPALGHLILLVFEAVMEVVCVSLPGYIFARQGMFDADKQKFVANLNVALFTPCLSAYSAYDPLALLTKSSLHETGVPIDGRKVPGVGRYPGYLHHTDTRFILSFHLRL
jgi:hypothetical protein